MKKGLKDAYLEAKAASNETINISVIEVLKEMAECDIAPDGDYSDNEIRIWEMFRSAMQRGRWLERRKLSDFRTGKPCWNQ